MKFGTAANRETPLVPPMERNVAGLPGLSDTRAGQILLRGGNKSSRISGCRPKPGAAAMQGRIVVLRRANTEIPTEGPDFLDSP